MSIYRNLLARMEQRHAGQRGLALLDVLLGMAIFALIVVIGVQNFSALRDRAYTTQVSSDVKQTATAIQAYMTSPNAVLPADTTAATWTEAIDGVNLTDGNSIATYAPVGANGEFTVCVQRGTAGPSAVYDSGSSAVTTASGACA